MINKLTTKRGFTLVETLVAITILISAIAGPLTLAFKGFSVATVAKDQITSFFLAQDALEYIRFVRDTNLLSGGDWLTGAGGSGGIDLSSCIGSICRFDSIEGSAPVGCSTDSGGVCLFLKYNTTTGTYQYTNGANTIFRRTVSIISVTADEIIASTTISWTGASGITRSVTLFESLLNWP